MSKQRSILLVEKKCKFLHNYDRATCLSGLGENECEYFRSKKVMRSCSCWLSLEMDAVTKKKPRKDLRASVSSK